MRQNKKSLWLAFVTSFGVLVLLTLLTLFVVGCDAPIPLPDDECGDVPYEPERSPDNPDYCVVRDCENPDAYVTVPCTDVDTEAKYRAAQEGRWASCREGKDICAVEGVEECCPDTTFEDYQRGYADGVRVACDGHSGYDNGYRDGWSNGYEQGHADSQDQEDSDE